MPVLWSLGYSPHPPQAKLLLACVRYCVCLPFFLAHVGAKVIGFLFCLQFMMIWNPTSSRSCRSTSYDPLTPSNSDISHVINSSEILSAYWMKSSLGPTNIHLSITVHGELENVSDLASKSLRVYIHGVFSMSQYTEKHLWYWFGVRMSMPGASQYHWY